MRSTQRMSHSRRIISVLLILSVLLSCTTCVQGLEQDGGTTNSTTTPATSGLFRLEYPNSEKQMFASLFNGPPRLFSANLYVHESIVNFTISVSSTKPDIADVVGKVRISPCVAVNSTQKISVIVSGEDNPTEVEPDVSYSVHDNTTYYLSSNMTCYNISLRVQGVYLGYTTLELTANYTTQSKTEESWQSEMFTRLRTKCIRFRRPIDKVFQITIFVMVAFATLGMGNGMDVPTIKTHLRKPKAPLIALASQYTFMPLLAYSVVYIMGYKGGWALGMFLTGCSPGGGPSNMYSKLLNGDMSISITMTTLSTFACLAMLPFWIYTLGSTIPSDDEIGKVKIPFLSILQSLALIIVPLLIGLLIQYKLPRVSKVIKKGLKVFFIILILFFFTIGIYSNLYIYQAFRADIVFSGALLPYGGYLFGGLLAWICRLEWKLIKTVALETGMQNVPLTMVVIKSSLPYPDSDLAIIPAFAAGIMTVVPIMVFTAGYIITGCIMKRRAERLRKAKEENGDTKLNEAGSDEAGSDIMEESHSSDSNDKDFNKREKTLSPVEDDCLLAEEKDLS